MSLSKLFFVLLILLVFPASVFSSEAFEVLSEKVFVSDIESAGEALASAYEAVLDAEQAGADVSDLLVRLNVAGGYLADARIWHSLGNFDNATRFANLCYDAGEEVRNEAYELENEAYRSRVTSLVVRTTGSMIGVIIIIFLSLLGWRAFKRRYQKRVLGMKPEVVQSES